MALDALSLLGPAGALIGGFLVVGLIVMLAAYVFMAMVLMTIGKKLKIGSPWMAWVPIVNAFYIPMLAGFKWYYGFLWILAMIPAVGFLASIGLTIWWWWKIAEARKKPGWYGILMIIPVVQWIFMGLIAWQD